MGTIQLKVAGVSFLIPFCWNALITLLNFLPFHTLSDVLITILVILFSCSIPLLIYINYRQIAIRAALLGGVCSFGIRLAFSPFNYSAFGVYLSVLAIFHWSEYLSVAAYSPSTLKLSSFLLDHSKEYWIAAVASWVEFAIEVNFIPHLKELWWISLIGLMICIGGEVIRKGAMITAGSNFTHLISYHKSSGHNLVTHGLYSIFRHPGYVGWFWWSIGTQLILVNPICLVGYAWASWTFFKERVVEEEIQLINFFGEEYVTYQRRVPTGIPGITGYSPDDY